MKEEYCKFIEENNLAPFNKPKTSLNTNQDSIYKTRDGKTTHNRLITKISSSFNFSDTSNLWNNLPFTSDINEIKKRQAFFNEIKELIGTDFLKQLKIPRQIWSPKYEIVAITENEETFVQLNKIGCPTQFLITERDLVDLDKYDIVQVIDCENFKRHLESLPQTVFIENIDDIYLERYLEILSGWKENLLILKQNSKDEEIKEIISELEPLLHHLEEKRLKIITREYVEKTLETINHKIEEKLKDLTISGSTLMKILNEKKFPEELQKTITTSIDESEIPSYIFNITIPVSVDEKELADLIKRQSATEFTDLAESIKSKATLLKSIPSKLNRISKLIILTDFLGGVSQYIQNTNSHPEKSEELTLENSRNYFLDNAQPINFKLTDQFKCSILTGANSGGKTTLLEHVIQSISLFQLGLPTNGKFSSPIFTEVYYFAKNKGAANKGAFENLLTQMSEIKPGKQTLILADEIESVTEPGVAGKIIASTAEFFLNKNCFLIIATHLGHEIQKVLPAGARIDGIEAKGLDENFNLIVDHNPVLGRLAHSTT